MLRKCFAVMLPLIFIVMITSLYSTGSGAAGPGNSPAGNVPQKSATITAYIKQLQPGVYGGGSVTVDPVSWYEGEAAVAAFAEHEPDAGIDGPPDGYYIVNDDEQLTSYPIDPDAVILLQIYDRTGKMEDIQVSGNEPVSLQKFAKLYQDTDLLDMSQFPYHLTLQNGRVTRIVQQYIP